MIASSLLARAIRVAALLFVTGVILSGCATARMDAPEAFAVFDGERTFVSTSPEGVVLRARLEDNNPEQDLSFWSEALERNLIDSGYIAVEDGSGSFEAPSGDGRYFQWLAPVGREDWFYLTAVTVSGKWIVVAEAAGPYEYYRDHQASLLESLTTLRIERSL